MSGIGIIVHLGRRAAVTQAAELADWLVALGVDTRLPRPEAEAVDRPDLGVDDEAFADGLGLVVTFGGDGSILRAVELVGETEVPILGVDHGQLGYLTEVEPGEAHDALHRVLEGDHDVEERMLLRVRLHRADGSEVGSWLALNEAVLERTADVNTIRIAVDLDDEFFTTYAADGLIVATPTGSTAYAFSVRGPIVEPTHRAVLLTPVSPHMLFDRSLVFAPTTGLRLRVDGHRPTALSVDGRRLAVLADGDAIEVAAAARSARLVTFGPRRFHRVLKAKFGLNDR